MNLNLPILDQLKMCKNVLIAGMGGGFDIFCGLPIYFDLKNQGQSVHLANFSFTDIQYLKDGIRLSETLVGVTGEHKDILPYFPEGHLAKWFATHQQQSVTIWSFQKTGVMPLLNNYRLLVEHLKIDGLLLLDGGVDSLIQGNEPQTGTLLEDSISLCAVNQLHEIPTRLLGCIGLGAERDISYANIFENIALLTQAGGFLGCCALTPQMPVYQAYEQAVLFVQSQPIQDSSVINSSIISAVKGHFGDYHLTEKTKGSHLWISPLMSCYWFFDLWTVAQQHLFLDKLLGTMTFRDVAQVYMATKIPKKPQSRIRL